MGITVQHQPGAGAVSQASYLAGLGDLARFQVTRQDRKESQLLDIKAKVHMQQKGLDARQELVESQFDQQEHMFNLQAEQQKGMQASGQQFQLIKAKGEEALWEQRYTFKQKQDMERNASAHRLIDESETFTPAQKAQAHRAIDLKNAGLNASWFPKEQPDPVPMEDWTKSNTWPAEDGGTWYRQPDGDIKYQAPQKDDAGQKAIDLEQKLKEFELKTQQSRLDHMIKLAGLMKEVAGPEGASKSVPIYAKEEIEKKLDAIYGAAPAPEGMPQKRVKPATPVEPEKELPPPDILYTGQPKAEWSPEMLEAARRAMVEAKKGGIVDREELKVIGAQAANAASMAETPEWSQQREESRLQGQPIMRQPMM